MQLTVGIKAVLFAALLSGVLPAAASADALTAPPAGYVYAATAGCPFTGVVYHACDDQMQRFASASAAARSEDKMLLVVLGADWCPWCRALDKLLPAEVLARKDEHFDYGARFAVVNIAVSALVNGRRVKVPSGEAVADLVMNSAKGRRSGGIPYFLFIDPRTGAVTHRQTGDLEDTWSNHGGGHDPEKVRAALREAYAKLRP